MILLKKRLSFLKKTNANPKLSFFPYLFFSVYLVALPAFSFADVVDTLNNFFTYLTGPFGKAIATLAIVGLGFGCFMFGKVPKSVLISVVIGIGIIFGAAALLNMLSG